MPFAPRNHMAPAVPGQSYIPSGGIIVCDFFMEATGPALINAKDTMSRPSPAGSLTNQPRPASQVLTDVTLHSYFEPLALALVEETGNRSKTSFSTLSSSIIMISCSRRA